MSRLIVLLAAALALAGCTGDEREGPDDSAPPVEATVLPALSTTVATTTGTTVTTTGASVGTPTTSTTAAPVVTDEDGEPVVSGEEP